MVEVLADPALYHFTGGEPPTFAGLRRRFEAQVAGGPPDGSERWHTWIVRVAARDRAIGFVQATVTDRGRRADIAWVIDVPWQGRGYATEAAGALVAWLLEAGTEDITAHVRADHAASARVARGAGLVATDVFEEGERVWRLGSGPGPGPDGQGIEG